MLPNGYWQVVGCLPGITTHEFDVLFLLAKLRSDCVRDRCIQIIIKLHKDEELKYHKRDTGLLISTASLAISVQRLH